MSGSPLNDFFDRVFCLNLERRPDRWAYVSGVFERFGIEVERFNAFDSTNVMGTCGQTPSQFAFNLSQIEMVKHAWERGLRSALLPEDDVFFDPALNSVFSAAIEELPGDWDMLYLGGTHQRMPVRFSPHVARLQETFTTHAYAVNGPAFEKILYRLRLGHEAGLVADNILQWFQPHLRAFIIQPECAFQCTAFSSDIRKARANPKG